MTARRMTSMMAMVLVVAMASACSDAMGPEPSTATGAWAGSLTHPAYDGGSLTLNLTDVNGVVSGSYRLILVKRVGGRASKEESGGRISGSSAGGQLTLRMSRSRGEEWVLDGRLAGSRVSGEWSLSRRTRGTFEVSR